MSQHFDADWRHILISHTGHVGGAHERDLKKISGPASHLLRTAGFTMHSQNHRASFGAHDDVFSLTCSQIHVVRESDGLLLIAWPHIPRECVRSLHTHAWASEQMQCCMHHARNRMQPSTCMTDIPLTFRPDVHIMSVRRALLTHVIRRTKHRNREKN